MADWVSKRHATFTINSVEYDASVSKFEVTADDAGNDFVTFAAALEGGAKEYTLNLTFPQDHSTGSLWELMEANVGQEIDVLYRPYGNATATATRPHFEFTVTVTRPNGTILGGEADSSTTAVNTLDVEWKLTAAPVKVTS